MNTNLALELAVSLAKLTAEYLVIAQRNQPLTPDEFERLLEHWKLVKGSAHMQISPDPVEE